MLFELKKLVGQLLMPLPLSLLLMVTGVVVLRCRLRRTGIGLAAAGLLILLVAGNRGVGLWLVGSLEQTYVAAAVPAAGGAHAEALARCTHIYVLGSAHSPAENLEASQKLSGSGLARVVEAARLARALPDAKVVVSGPPTPDGSTHARVQGEALIALGVDARRLTEVDHAFDTDDEMEAIGALAGKQPVALVTSAWHMPRAMRLAAAFGVNAVPCPTDFSGRPDGRIRIIDFFIWNTSALGCTTQAAHEYLGLTWTRLRTSF